MLQRLKNRIETFIISAASLMVILATVSVCFTFRISFTNDFIDHSVQSAEQLNNNIKMNLTSLEAVANLLSHNVRIVDVLSDSTYNGDTISLLDNLTLTNMNVAGVCLYGLNGMNYFSSSTYSPPPLEFLTQFELPADFARSPVNMTWILRENLPEEYADYSDKYRSSQGLFSCVSKVKNESDQLLGYLLLDIPINNIYSFPTNRDNIFLNTTNVYILNRQNVPVYCFTHRDQEEDEAVDTSFLSDNTSSPVRLKKGVAIVSDLENTNAKTLVYSSFRYIQNTFYTLLCFLIALDLLFILMIVFLVRPLSRSIHEPLQRLYEKMKGVHRLIE